MRMKGEGGNGRWSKGWMLQQAGLWDFGEGVKLNLTKQGGVVVWKVILSKAT